jgi:hypothetical protein
VIAMLISLVVDVIRSVWDVVSGNSVWIVWLVTCFITGYGIWWFVRASLVRR